MRNIYLILLMILFISPISAQTLAPELEFQFDLVQEQRHKPFSSAKSSNILNSYRLIAFNIRENVNGLLENSDSAVISYSGSRSGDIFNELYYDEATTFTWDGFIYENNRKLTRKYTAANKLEEEITEVWDGALWVNEYRSTYTYDASNNLISNTSQNWSSNTWENSGRNIFTYSNGLRESLTYQNWNGSSWDNIYRYIYTYNSSDMVDIELRQNFSAGTWKDYRRTIHTYNTDDKIAIELTQELVSGTWEDKTRTNTTYTANNEIMSITNQSWNGTAWVNTSRRLNDYDSGNNLIKTTYQVFKSGAWENSSKDEYIYDNNGTVKTFNSYTWDGTIWVIDQEYTLYYESFVGIPSLAKTPYKIYPNPFTNTFTFKFSESAKLDVVNIFDLSGRLVYTNRTNANSELEIDGSKFPAGVYFYQIKGNEGMETGKLIKQ